VTALVVAAAAPAVAYVLLVVAGLVRAARADRERSEAVLAVDVRRLLEAAEMECKFFAHGRIDRG